MEMQTTTEIDIDSAAALIGLDYKDPSKVIKLLKQGRIIPLISITAHELRIVNGNIMLYNHS